jgi:protein arginine kinase activator
MTTIENGKKVETHLCGKCAASAIGFDLTPSIVEKSPAGRVVASSNSKCGRCGMTFKKILQSGRLGCADDYDIFRAELLNVLKQIHGLNAHVGKVPGRDPNPKAFLEIELIKLKEELESLVKLEEYEKAAELRDKIKNIEKELAG